MDDRKLNTEFIMKEVDNLYTEAYNEFKEKLKSFNVRDITDDDRNNDGTNTLKVIVKLVTDKNILEVDYNDIYRKHQMLGKGAGIDYDVVQKHFDNIMKGEKTLTSLPGSFNDIKVQSPIRQQLSKEEILDMIKKISSINTSDSMSIYAKNQIIDKLVGLL